MHNSFTDLIIRIKNGYMARKETILVKKSRFNESILKKLKELSYVASYEQADDAHYYEVSLKYDEGMPAVTEVRIYSKPGRRFYVSYKELKPVIGGMGYSVISTPKGIITNIEAQKEKVGGELLFNIW